MRRRLLTTAGIILALAGLLAPPSATAQETCRSRCWDAYGACYKSTSNRQRCQSQLFRCLSNCIRAKRTPATEAPAPTRWLAEEFRRLGHLRQLLAGASCVGLSPCPWCQLRPGARRL